MEALWERVGKIVGEGTSEKGDDHDEGGDDGDEEEDVIDETASYVVRTPLFGGCDGEIRIAQSQRVGMTTGWKIWNAALLCKTVLQNEAEANELAVVGGSLVDVSSGTGIVGFAAAWLGYHNIVLTDVREAMYLLEENSAANYGRQASRVPGLDDADADVEHLPTFAGVLSRGKDGKLLSDEGEDVVIESAYTWCPAARGDGDDNGSGGGSDGAATATAAAGAAGAAAATTPTQTIPSSRVLAERANEIKVSVAEYRWGQDASRLAPSLRAALRDPRGCTIVFSDVLFIAIRDGLLKELATAMCELLWHKGSVMPPRVLFAYEERLPLEEQRFLDQLSAQKQLFKLREIPNDELDFSEVDAAASGGEGTGDDDDEGDDDENGTQTGGLGALFFQRPPLRLFWITRGATIEATSTSTAMRDLLSTIQT